MGNGHVGRPEQQSPSEACLRADADLARAFVLLGKRWTAVVLGVLSGGPTGFRDLSRVVRGHVALDEQ